MVETQNSNKWHELAKCAIHSFFLTGAEAKLLRTLEDLERPPIKAHPLSLYVASPPDDPGELTEANKEELYKIWGPERTLRPSFLAWLFDDKDVQPLIRHKSISISNCLISSTNSNTIADSHVELDLTDATLPFTLTFDHCVFPEKISLNRVTIRELTLDHCWLLNWLGAIWSSKGILRSHIGPGKELIRAHCSLWVFLQPANTFNFRVVAFTISRMAGLPNNGIMAICSDFCSRSTSFLPRVSLRKKFNSWTMG